MSGAVMTSIAVGVGSSIAGSLVSSMLAPDGQAPTPAEPTPAPQSASAPDASMVRAGNTGGGAGAGAGATPASTLLTGSDGVDPNKLKLGSSLLTGSATPSMGA